MTLVILFAGLGMLCVLLWYCAVYALPVFMGFWVGWWALNQGAGAGSVMVGLIAGVALWLAGCLSATSGNPLVRLVGLALFVIPAACAGFWMLDDLAGGAAAPWRNLFGILGAIGVGSVTYARLTTANKGS